VRFKLTPSGAPQRENDVERACLDLLALRGYWVGRNHCGTFKSADNRRWIKGAPKGTPDYATLHRNYPGFLMEVKRPGAATSSEQDQKHFEIRLAYGIAIATVDSVAALAAWLDHHEGRG
jgi:hypothetical protein